MNLNFIPALLVLITVIAFMPTFSNDFQLGWDDTWMVFENPLVIDFDNLKYAFTGFYHGQYGPINDLMYKAIYESFGFNAMIFHTVCLVIHLFNVILIFYVLKQIIQPKHRYVINLR